MVDKEFLEVKCPDCGNILIVNKRSGEVVEVREPILEESTGDRFEDAFKKVKDSKATLEDRFEAARAKEKERQSKLDSLFKEGLERAREEGVNEKPKRDFDLD